MIFALWVEDVRGKQGTAEPGEEVKWTTDGVFGKEAKRIDWRPADAHFGRKTRM